ncbi:hypothetical protein SALB1_0441 [Salinisphaera sp. LB1]|nr:hypothetical protein SALB1_0441 [Salinisphaera sp. LB1]
MTLAGPGAWYIGSIDGTPKSVAVQSRIEMTAAASRPSLG